jgi:hypothetical protein
VYSGHESSELDFHGLPISLRSESGDPSRCLIDLDDAPGYDVAFRFDDGEGPGAEVVGIGIRDRAASSLPVIACWTSSPSFRDLLISNASSSVDGIVALGGSQSRFTGCTFAGNGTGGNTPAVFRLRYNSHATLDRCLIADNAAASFLIEGATAALTCSDIFGNSGGDWIPAIAGQLGQAGNFSEDPFFCDATEGDYHLSGGSPCLPEGNDCGVLVGALGLGCGGTGIAEPAPRNLALAAQPNPFNPQVTLRFGLAAAVSTRASRSSSGTVATRRAARCLAASTWPACWLRGASSRSSWCCCAEPGSGGLSASPPARPRGRLSSNPAVLA